MSKVTLPSLYLDKQKLVDKAKELGALIHEGYARTSAGIGCIDGIFFRLEAISEDEAESTDQAFVHQNDECMKEELASGQMQPALSKAGLPNVDDYLDHCALQIAQSFGASLDTIKRGLNCLTRTPEKASGVALATQTAQQRYGSMGIPISCGGPLCRTDEHHQLCEQAAQPVQAWAQAQAKRLSPFDAVARAMDLASLLAGSVGMNNKDSADAYSQRLRRHLIQYIYPPEQPEQAQGGPAEVLPGWKFNHTQEVDSDGIWALGWRDPDDGVFAPFIEVDTGEYFQPKDAEPLARAILARLTAAPTTQQAEFATTAGHEAAAGHLSALVDEAQQILADLHQYAIDLQEQTRGGRSERGEVPIMDLAEDWLAARPDLAPQQTEPSPEVFLASTLLGQVAQQSDACALWVISALSKLAKAEPRMTLSELLELAAAAMPQAADLYTGKCELQPDPFTADVECITDESGTDYSISVRGPGICNALQSDVWLKKEKQAELLASWLNNEVLPAVARKAQP